MQDNKRPQENERTVRDALHSRAFKNGAYASVLCAVMLALVVALNLFVGALPAKYLRYDMTENKLYSLSQETEDLCAALTQDVTFYYLGRTGQEDAAVTELLDKYKDASSHIQVVQKDPVLYPTFGAAYDAADAAVGSIIAVCGERYRVVDAGDLYTYTPNYQTYTYDTEFDGEGALTSALSYVASEEAPLLYTLSGHGEAGLSATLTDGAERQNMSFETLALLTADAVPEDAAAVVLNAPTKDISAEEAERLRTYLAGGGSLFLVTNYGDYSTEAMPNLTALLAEYGMGARDGIVIENDQNRFLSGYPYYLLPNIKSHDVTQPLVDSGSYVLAPLAHAITVLDEMNIARVEYYFAEFLSLMELPDTEERYLDVVTDKREKDPKGLKGGRIKLPKNMWFIGTANNDDSTFAISDKVYDRAMMLNLDEKSEVFEGRRS